MDEIREEGAERNDGSEQIVFFAPELLQMAQQRQERLDALRAAAESGDQAALLELGIYDLGELGGAPRSADEAFACLSRLPEDDAAGRYYLSYCYERGVGAPADTARASALLAESAEGGFPPALCALGLCYESGHGVEKDRAKAAELYRAAADKGFAPGMCNLGVLMLDGADTEADAEEAAALFAQAAEQGFPRAVSRTARARPRTRRRLTGFTRLRP